jgi:hypothetical protein
LVENPQPHPQPTHHSKHPTSNPTALQMREPNQPAPQSSKAFEEGGVELGVLVSHVLGELERLLPFPDVPLHRRVHLPTSKGLGNDVAVVQVIHVLRTRVPDVVPCMQVDPGCHAHILERLPQSHLRQCTHDQIVCLKPARLLPSLILSMVLILTFCHRVKRINSNTSNHSQLAPCAALMSLVRWLGYKNFLGLVGTSREKFLIINPIFLVKGSRCPSHKPSLMQT